MRLTISTTKNYTEFQQVYQLKLPLELERLIPVDDSVRLLSQMLEGLNYSKLYQAYSIKGRKPAVDPKTTAAIHICRNSLMKKYLMVK
jgi:transposase